MEVLVQESLERRQRAAKHLLMTSSLEGLIDVDHLREEAESEKEFELDETQVLFQVFKAVMGNYSSATLNDVLFSLSNIDRGSALEALKMAYSIEDVVRYETIN